MYIKIPKVNSMYRAGLLLLTVKVIYSASGIYPSNDLFDTILSLLGAGCLAYSIYKKKYPLYVGATFAVIILLALYTCVQIENVSLFLTVITCIALCGENIDDSIHFVFSYECILVILQIIVAIFLVFWGTPITSRVSGVMKVNFGFTHPNVFSVLLTNLIFMYGWINYKTIRGKKTAFILLLALLCYLFTGSRSSIFIVTIYSILLLIYKNPIMKYKSLKNIAAFIVPIFSVLMYILSQLYSKGNLIVIGIDTLLSGRIKLGAFAIKNCDLTWLGQAVENITVKWDSFWKLNNIVFDNVYVYLYINIGIVWLVLIGVMFYKLAQKEDTRINIAIVVWALYGITELHGINPFMFFPVMLVSLLYRKKRGNKELE